MILIAALAGAAAAQPLGLTPPLANVPFDIGATNLPAGGMDELRTAVAWAHDHPYRLLVIEGYADQPGGDAVNLALSQDRADVVRAALIHLGVEPSRLVDAAHGSHDDSPGRRAVVRGTLEDYRTLIQAQH